MIGLLSLPLAMFLAVIPFVFRKRWWWMWLFALTQIAIIGLDYIRGWTWVSFLSMAVCIFIIGCAIYMTKLKIEATRLSEFK